MGHQHMREEAAEHFISCSLLVDHANKWNRFPGGLPRRVYSITDGSYTYFIVKTFLRQKSISCGQPQAGVSLPHYTNHWSVSQFQNFKWQHDRCRLFHWEKHHSSALRMSKLDVFCTWVECLSITNWLSLTAYDRKPNNKYRTTSWFAQFTGCPPLLGEQRTQGQPFSGSVPTSSYAKSVDSHCIQCLRLSNILISSYLQSYPSGENERWYNLSKNKNKPHLDYKFTCKCEIFKKHNYWTYLDATLESMLLDRDPGRIWQGYWYW